MKNKVQVVIIAFSIVIAIVSIIVFSNTGDPKPGQGGGGGGTLIVWGVDPKEIFGGLFAKYAEEVGTTIVYVEKDERTIHQEVLEAIASEKSPDLLVVPDSWIRDNKDKIATPLPAIVNVENAKNSMVELGTQLLVEEKIVDGKLQQNMYGLPLWLDPIVLFWNRELFEQAKPEPIALPPKDWDEFVRDSKKLTKLADGKQVTRAGAALGRAHNIPLYKEILSLLLLQLNSDIEDGIFLGGAGSKEAADGARSAIKFYTDFGNPNTAPGGAYSWNPRLPEPRALFIEGKLGMMLDLYSFKDELKAKNPHLAFDVASVPQLRDDGKRTQKTVNYAAVRAITVLKGGENQNNAWFFAKWLANPEQIKSIIASHDVAPVIRSMFSGNEVGGLLKTASLTARRPRETFPKENSRIVRDLIESVADGGTITESMAKAGRAFNFYLQSQGIR
ncbi:MAG: extracellular solute-binding protein [Candidatus Ryanbacteria bacterium]|nr:extracellular solute-binding protein [Candidatus Ryanbacteria bacterium]